MGEHNRSEKVAVHLAAMTTPSKQIYDAPTYGRPDVKSHINELSKGEA
jgi:hypothetical protein